MKQQRRQRNAKRADAVRRAVAVLRDGVAVLARRRASRHRSIV
jgi:hypothetical protein